MLRQRKGPFLDVGHRIEHRWDDLRRRVKARLGWLDPATILPFRGYGDGSRLRLKGRVLESGGLDRWEAGASAWSNLARMLHRFESDEVPGARVRATFGGRETEVTTNDEGYFEVALDDLGGFRPDLIGDQRWREVELELLEPPRADQESPARAIAQVLMPLGQARLGVISDIDDTIIQTGANDLVRNWRTILLSSAEGRSPFKGVATFYRALERGTHERPINPIFYVSSSPWNLYDLLERFMALNHIPPGPMFLRDFGLDRNRFVHGPHDEHKLDAIERLLAFYRALPFVLIGDSGQHDAAIYREVVRRHPGRVLAVYIRDLSSSAARAPQGCVWREEVEDAGTQAAFGPDLIEAAENAAANGWIEPATVSEVRQEVHASVNEV